VPEWQHAKTMMIYVCVADLICGHQAIAAPNFDLLSALLSD